MYQTTLDEVIIKTIRNRVKKGKTKIEVANELDISYYIVKKYTKDIPTILRIPVELEQKIRDKVRKGKSIRQVAEELNVSRDTVINYTRDIPKRPEYKRKRSPELIKQIRANVRKYNSKSETAKKMGLTYWIVIYYTRDITLKKEPPTEIINKIRKMVKNGKTKMQTARELNININIVSNYTKDIYKIPKKADISYNSFILLQEIICKGYAFQCKHYGITEYQILKKKFPTLYKFRRHGRTIFYLEDKSDIAVKAYLESLTKKITNYYHLKEITKSFKISISNEEKKRYIHKKKLKKLGYGKNFEAVRFREKDDSFVKIELFHLLISSSSECNFLRRNDLFIRRKLTLKFLQTIIDEKG